MLSYTYWLVNLLHHVMHFACWARSVLKLYTLCNTFVSTTLCNQPFHMHKSIRWVTLIDQLTEGKGIKSINKSDHNQEEDQQAGGHGQSCCFHSVAGAVSCAAVLMNVVLLQTSDSLKSLDDYRHSEVHPQPAHCAAVHAVLCCKYKFNHYNL